jgi:D-3-phosphoglycerate dehydrogenase
MKTLRDLTVGVVGFGRIGREVVARLKGFKCRIIVFDPVVAADAVQAAGAESVSLDELLAQSDAVTLHCPSNAATRGLMNSATFSKLRPGTILINVARGDLVDPSALIDAIDQGQVCDAGLDVFATEPIPADHPIRERSGVILQSHIASASVPAVRKLRETVARAAAAALAGEPLSNVVNGVTGK